MSEDRSCLHLINSPWIPHPGNAVCSSGGWKTSSFLRQRKCAEQAIVDWQSFSLSDTNILWKVPTKTYCIGSDLVGPYYDDYTYTGSTILISIPIVTLVRIAQKTNAGVKLMQGKLSRAAAQQRNQPGELQGGKHLPALFNPIRHSMTQLNSTKCSEGKVWKCLSYKGSPMLNSCVQLWDSVYGIVQPR